MQIVATAIKESKPNGRIIYIEALDAKRAGVSLEAIHSELYDECERRETGRDVEGTTLYIGRDVNGEDWCVRVDDAGDS